MLQKEASWGLPTLQIYAWEIPRKVVFLKIPQKVVFLKIPQKVVFKKIFLNWFKCTNYSLHGKYFTTKSCVFYSQYICSVV